MRNNPDDLANQFISKIKKELKWEPKINFEVGIKNTINWYLKHHKIS